MNATSQKLDAKQIYQKSIRVLSDTQEQLSTVRKVLNKTVVSLSAFSHSGNESVDKVLESLKVPDESSDLDFLDKQLDALLAVISRPDKKISLVKEENNDVDIGSKLTSIVTDILVDLSLKGDEANTQKASLLKELKQPENTDAYWEDVVSRTTVLINGSVESLQKKNNDLQGFIAKVNKQLIDIKSFVRMTEKSREESINRSSDLKESVDTSVGEIKNKVSSANDIDVLKKDISIYLEKIRDEVENNDDAEQEKEKVSVESFAHITKELNSSQEELAKLKEQLKETKIQLLKDTLTGLYNRLAFEDRIEIEMSRSRRTKSPLTIAMWDIDHFKNVNDSYGHDVGDRVLKAFSEIIVKRIRKTDMFARIGGEEFVLVMPDTASDVAKTLNDELREIFLKCKFNFEDTTFSATSSVGIADFCDDDTAESVLKKADLALYESKDGGRNCCTIYKPIEE